jgi:hypothetical protein
LKGTRFNDLERTEYNAMEQLLVIKKTELESYFQTDRNNGTSLYMLKEPADSLNGINLPSLWVQ